MPIKKKNTKKKVNGRPPKYDSSDTLDKRIVAYIKRCDKNGSMPNKAGLCVWLGISRDTYNEYKKKFPDTLKAVEAFIEDAWVQRLAATAATGAIFYLKNAFKEHYRDRTETDITTQSLPFNLTIVQKDGGQKG